MSIDRCAWGARATTPAGSGGAHCSLNVASQNCPVLTYFLQAERAGSAASEGKVVAEHKGKRGSRV